MKLTANTHGHEFELMPHVVIQYDASMIGDMVHIDDGFMLCYLSTSIETNLHNASMIYNQYGDEAGIKPAIEDHFINQVF